MNSTYIDFEFKHDKIYKKVVKNGILLFHGLTGSPYEMKKYGRFLFQQGFDVFCYSLPGHGEKIKEIQSVTYKNWCEFAQEKYNSLRNDYENFFVSGLCLGALLAIYLSENNSDISGIILLSTTLFLDGFSIPLISKLMPIGLNTIIKYYYTFSEDDTLGIKNELTRKTLLKIMSKTEIGLNNYPLSCVGELLKLSKIVRKELKKVKCPMLCIHSKCDNLSSTKGVKMIMNNISSKNKKYIELNNSYHMILYDNERDLVFNSVNIFLNQIIINKEMSVACSLC